MSLLDKKNWWLYLIITIMTGGAGSIIICNELKLFNDKAWYANYKNWLIGLLCLIFPFFVMMGVFIIETLVLAAARLNVPGKEIYLSPYIWLLCLIIPFIGWAVFIVLFIYLEVMNIVYLARGYAK